MLFTGSTALIHASIKGRLLVAKHLIEHKANIEAMNNKHNFIMAGWTPLIYASYHGHLPVVKLLLQHNANIEARNNNGMFLNLLPHFHSL